MAPFSGDLAEMGTLQRALEVENTASIQIFFCAASLAPWGSTWETL